MSEQATLPLREDHGEPWDFANGHLYARWRGQERAWIGALDTRDFAERAVECVNALAGHYPARMESGSVARLIEAAKAIARDVNTMQPGRLESLTDDSFALFDPDEEVGLVAGDLRAFLDALRAVGVEVEA